MAHNLIINDTRMPLPVVEETDSGTLFKLVSITEMSRGSPGGSARYLARMTTEWAMVPLIQIRTQKCGLWKTEEDIKFGFGEVFLSF